MTSMDSRPRDPWREVIHIDVGLPGKHGAKPWILRLSCGHFVARSRADTSDSLRVAARLLAEGRLRFAPKKVRCIHCGLKEADANRQAEDRSST